MTPARTLRASRRPRSPRPTAAVVLVLALAAAGPALTTARAAGATGEAQLAAVPAPPVRYEGYEFASQARVAGTVLLMNGYGKRDALGIYKPYSAALYLTRHVATGDELFADPGPKRLELRMLMNGPSWAFADAFLKGIQKRVPAERRDEMKDRIQAFDTLLRSIGDLNKGDVVDLDYVPGTGVVLTQNGRMRGHPIAGKDLYDAMLAIFAGRSALDKPLSAALLGGPPN